MPRSDGFLAVALNMTAGKPSFLVSHYWAGAEQIAIAVNVVDPGDRGPEFVLARPGRRKGGLLARVGMVPFVRGDLLARCAARF